jgi:hypothetical protein
LCEIFCIFCKTNLCYNYSFLVDVPVILTTFCRFNVTTLCRNKLTTPCRRKLTT